MAIASAVSGVPLTTAYGISAAEENEVLLSLVRREFPVSTDNRKSEDPPLPAPEWLEILVPTNNIGTIR